MPRAAAKSAEVIALTIVLRRSDPVGLEQLVTDLYDPRSPQFRRFLTPEQVSDRFGPAADEVERVQAFFESQGLAVGQVPGNRLTLLVTGTRGDVENALGVRIADYQRDGQTFRANDRDPQLPADIATRVQAIIGLSDLARPRPQYASFIFSIIDAFCNVAGFFGGVGGIAMLQWDAQFLHARAKCLSGASKNLGMGALGSNDPPPPAWQGVDGSGQTIGLVAFDTFAPSDVQNYLALVGLPAAKMSDVTSVHVNGGATAGADQREVLIDIAQVLTGAPGAKIKVFDAPFSGAGSFQAVLNAMINGGVGIISNSWAYCEDQTTLADVQSIEAVLTTAAASGISVLSAAGDRGSTCLNGHPNVAHVPATAPHVTAVGGTTMTLGPGFTYASETWWDNSGATPPGGQGGFGVSRYFGRPAYQNGLTTSANRSIPDVSTNADPAQGIMLCQASDGGCPTGLLYGGTSAAAPAFAAYVALLNQSQGTNLGFLNPSFYPLANTAAFHTPSSMGSDFAHVGLGSPNLARLHQALTNQTTGPVSATVSEVAAFSATNFSMPPSLGPLPTLADGATPTYIVVRLADGFGNLIAGHTVQLSANSGTVVISPATGVSTVNNGAVVFTVTNLVAETVTFTASDVTAGTPLQMQPKVTFGVPPAASGGIVASPTTVAANGSSATTLTITLRDALNRPTPGKLVTLSQGSGHSVITAPNPAVTDVNGQIQFTATDTVAETVTYTAVDVTDGSLPVPGQAVVTFTGGSVSCLPAAPTAASGYTLTPFANGFVAQNFSYANINFVGCPGASNPAFDGAGNVFVSDFPTGDLYRFGAAGGAVSSANRLSNPGKTFGNLVVGRDGSLYGTTFSPSAIVQVDATSGAILRTLASGYTCPGGLAVDPLSGDLFFDDQCTGGGSDNPSIWRIQNPAGASPTVVVYATLPGTPGGQIAFAPDGTMYVVSTAFNNANSPIVRISGTNQPAPHTAVTVPGITADTGGLAIGEVLGSGAAKSLIVHSGGSPGGAGGSLKLIDLTTLAATVLANGIVEPGVVGPDGCMYVNGHDTILRLSPSSGGCGFAPTSPGPTLTLSPAAVLPNPPQGTQQSFTATFRNVAVATGTPVQFRVLGANAQTLFASTGAGGSATVVITGRASGNDRVQAGAFVNGTLYTSNIATLTWSTGRHATLVQLALTPATGDAGVPVTLTASLVDATSGSNAPVAGATLQFQLAGQSCSGTTDASGVAACVITPTGSGSRTLTVSFSGSGQFAPSAESQGFALVAAAPVSPPAAPVIGPATAGAGQASVSFTPPASDGGSPITGYSATCTPVGGGPAAAAIPVAAATVAALTVTGTASPIIVTGLTPGVTYTCTVSAINATGTGAPSADSNPVTIAGVVTPALPVNIPTLSAWMLMLLAVLLAAATPLLTRRFPRD